MTYQPKPIDTSGVKLDPSLVELTEFLASNTHDVWALRRIGEGWSHGPSLDADAKQHPDLVPYPQLPESEKEYDRNTAIEALKLILLRGYQIISPAGASSDGSAAVATSLPAADVKKMGVGQIAALWRRWDREKFLGAPEFYQQLAARALKLGEPLLAFDILTTALKRHKGNVRLRQLRAVALSRSGVMKEAIKLLEELIAEGHTDEETLGNLARTFKDRWEAARDPEARQRYLRQAFERYEEAYALNPDGYWSAINAATLAVCLGLHDRAAELARGVEAQCTSHLLSVKDDEAYWELATLGEAALVCRDFPAAAKWYGRAVAAAGDAYGDIGSTRRNAKILIECHGADAALLDQWLPLPPVVVFSGHMVDKPGRPVPRFPREIEPAVRDAIRAQVEAMDIKFAYASAACGSDILFLEAVADRGGEINIVLPYEEDRFKRDSITLIPGSDWEARFDALLKRERARMIIASHGEVKAVGMANEYANQLLFGLAGIRASQMRTTLKAFAVWDGKPGDGMGGTQSSVVRWRAFGIEPTIIDINALRDGSKGIAPLTSRATATPQNQSPAAPPRVATEPEKEFSGHMVALLFADVEGYSKLTEDEVPLFFQHVLKPVGALCAGAGDGCEPPVQGNTWGDGLYFVFRRVADAGTFALRLREHFTRTDWKAVGFLRTLNLRTGLHYGPVYKIRNPVTGRDDFTGTHVSRAARIEPITPPNEVYASEGFAAIAFADRVSGFTCDYVGQVGLHKDYGTYPTYHVRRK